MLAPQRIPAQRTKFHDCDFLGSVATKPSTPEFGGFNTKLTRMQGQGLKPRTKAMFTPLTDMTPSDPTTMKSAMLEAKRLTKKAGQATTLFTADLQLYCVGPNVEWAYPELFVEDFTLRLGVMHFLMSSVGAVWVLMAGSGLEELMKAAFGCVTKMLLVRIFPKTLEF